MVKNKGLGRGLSSLLGEEVLPIKSEIVQIINIDKIKPNENQPRKHFEYNKIKELADSILNNGLLQPIIVDNNFQIIAGERRWRACKLAQVLEIPVIIKNFDTRESMETALIENIQRTDLTVMEEARGFKYLVDNFNYTVEKLAERLGKSRSHIANLLRLNNLPQSIQDKLNENILSMGHARCLINHEYAEEIANHIINHDLNVRQTEALVRQWHKNEYKKSTNNTNKVGKLCFKDNIIDNDLELLVKALSKKFGIKITIDNCNLGGKLMFHYKDLEELDLILSKLN
ncbi:ParB/RepB/Spo0J family partition protein [Rickettsia typhi]|uniref:Probable chromosome-partitioning protein ParB n=2 Tax=Rickettsia typhi TaxID=785 RepID=PARB_RICTY|nr:ParB/RepB/Spo0J family partition protein [Rickettsia typhi]Q68XT3.1 RecName: Full=Probable chromosome-partitioning protein ParB [Rickettsia typhi str. Wilmington]AAU03559.1 chromosome partitioning protein ParB (Spo0J protein) [Rickettsia typhi str. Wilmington]AFE53936.1 Chromosome partitioning protein ParB (Spo0J protein) [Rickettsia typhi str. TH1527]AFE54774.1 Chromosome partitioning protein ParB (Spo0J protein) [Rickettsia typhi str. B9991CWPP]